MTLANMLRKKLAEPAVAAQARTTMPYQGWNIVFHPEAHDALSCSLWDVALERDVHQAGGDPRAWADRITHKVTGLLEPLKLVEVDAGRQIALLRSAEPTRQESGLDYHEIELHGTSRAVVRRFRGFAEADRKREQIPFPVTYEALGKLVAGITDPS